MRALAFSRRPDPCEGEPLPAVFSLIGHTPLVRLRCFEPGPDVEIYAKLEGRNPGGSVKDRAAASMLLRGLASGALAPGKTILDATSGNTGIAYAMLGAALGHKVRLCVPGNVTPERLQTLRVFGAEVIVTDALAGSDGAIREARRLVAESPDDYFYPDQYNNIANPQAHADTTAVEILEQTHGRVTHFVAGLGTSGTFVGTGRRLRASRPDVRLISAQPDSPLHAIEGWKHMETAIVPGIYDQQLADEDVRISTEEAWEMTRQLARRAGLLLGVSSGASLAAALHVARRLASGVVVTIFPDGGDRYLSERHWLQEGA
jgi:cysteine synthase B